MRVTLEVRSGLLIGRRFDVVPGPGTVFGRSEQASGFIPHDPEMGDFHFLVQWVDGEPRMKVLSQGTTTVNGEAATETVLASGDLIHAGRTAFEVKDLKVGGAAAAPPGEVATGAPPTPAATPPAASSDERTGPELLVYLGEDDEVVEVAQPGQGARELLEVFSGRKEWPVATRLRAYLFQPRDAIWWGMLCLKHVLGEELPEKERPGFAAAERWLLDPSEETRRAAEAIAPNLGESKMKNLSDWLCCGVFWSDGSISLPDLPEVPTDPRFTGQAINALLILLAYYGEDAVAHAESRFAHFLAIGDEVEKGGHPLPTRTAGV